MSTSSKHGHSNETTGTTGRQATRDLFNSFFSAGPSPDTVMTLLLVLCLVVFLVDFVVRCHDSFLNKVLDSRFIDMKLSRGAFGPQGSFASHLPVSSSMRWGRRHDMFRSSPRKHSHRASFFVSTIQLLHPSDL